MTSNFRIASTLRDICLFLSLIEINNFNLKIKTIWRLHWEKQPFFNLFYYCLKLITTLNMKIRRRFLSAILHAEVWTYLVVILQYYQVSIAFDSSMGALPIQHQRFVWSDDSHSDYNLVWSFNCYCFLVERVAD